MCGLPKTLHQKTNATQASTTQPILFAQMGEDARSSAEHGEVGIAAVIEHLVQTIEAFTSRTD